jgi:hypothetical protein
VGSHVPLLMRVEQPQAGQLGDAQRHGRLRRDLAYQQGGQLPRDLHDCL